MQSSLVAIAQCIYTDIPYIVKSKDCLAQLISFAASIPNNVHTSHSITLLVHYTSVNNLVLQVDVWHVKECKKCMLHMQPYCL